MRTYKSRLIEEHIRNEADEIAARQARLERLKNVLAGKEASAVVILPFDSETPVVVAVGNKVFTKYGDTLTVKTIAPGEHGYLFTFQESEATYDESRITSVCEPEDETDEHRAEFGGG